MINTVTISGRLCADPEHKVVSEDLDLTKFRLASDVGFGDNKRTIFVDVECWKGLARIVRDYTTQGSKVTLSGTLLQDVWQDDEGNNRSKIFIRATDLDLPAKEQ